MTILTLRVLSNDGDTTKGAPLTNAEIDGNFVGLKNGKPENDGTGATGTWGISINGSASSAATLTTGRSINGVSFNGSADVTIPINATNRTADESGHLIFIGTTATGNQSVYSNAGIRVNPGTGVLSATGFAGFLTGNASTATTLQNARTINGTSFNGSENITITANTGSTVTFNNGGTGATSGSTFNGSTAVTISYNTIGAAATNHAHAASDITSGQVAIARGGTNGTAAPTAGAIAYGTGSAYAFTSAGNAGQVLQSNGANAPTFVNLPVSATNLSWTAGTTAGPTVNSSTGTNATIPSASASASGVVTTGGQTLAGLKTFTGNISINNISPTISLRDTDNQSAFLHCNSNLLYVLRGGVNATTWTQVGGQWPLTINLNDNSMLVGGDLTAVGNITAYSDARYKKNIERILSPLDKVQQIGGYTFERINEVEQNIGKRRMGVIAQELEHVIPEVISTDKDGFMSVDYGNITALLIEAIKELKAEIDLLKGDR